MSPKRKANPLLLFILAGLFSCKGMEKASIPQTMVVPEKFNEDTSKHSIADLSVREFFTDSILVELLDEAIKNNQEVLITAQRIKSAKANLLQSKWAYMPFFSADAIAGVNKFGDYTMNGVGNFDTNLSDNVTGDKKIPNPTPDYLLGFNSSWEIDIWGKLRNKRKSAYSRLLASEKGRHLVITSLVAQVSELYFTLISLDQELQIIRNNILLQEKVVETITILKEGGRTTELAVQQSNAQLLSTRSLEYLILQEIVATETTINFLLGRFPQSIVRRKNFDSQFFPEKILPGVPSEMLLKRPDIRQAEFELRASEQEVKSARAAFLPSLRIAAFAGYNSFDASLLLNPASLAYGVLSGLSAPVLQGKKIKAGYRSAVASNYEAYYTYQKTIFNGFREVFTDLARIENYQQIVQLKAKEVEVLHLAVSSSDYLFRSGYASYLEVIIAQKTVLEAEISLVNAKKEQYISLVNLYRSLGGGWE